MTYIVRIVNPQMPDKDSVLPRAWIGHGELGALVSKLFSDRGVPVENVQVSWVDDPKIEDPFKGQRDAMVHWLNQHVAMGISEIEQGTLQISKPQLLIVPRLARNLRDEWKSRGFDMRLTQLVEVAKQVQAGWK